jgi:homoserine dehydrogenase
MREVGIGLLGFGTVGAGVAEGLLRNGRVLAGRLGVRPVLRRIADLDLESDDVDLADTGQTEPEFPVQLSKSEWRVFRVRSAPYDHRWTTKVDVQVESQEGGL